MREEENELGMNALHCSLEATIVGPRWEPTVSLEGTIHLEQPDCLSAMGWGFPIGRGMVSGFHGWGWGSVRVGGIMKCEKFTLHRGRA